MSDWWVVTSDGLAGPYCSPVDSQIPTKLLGLPVVRRLPTPDDERHVPGRHVLVYDTYLATDFHVGQTILVDGVLWDVKSIEAFYTGMGRPQPKPGVGLVVQGVKGC